MPIAKHLPIRAMLALFLIAMTLFDWSQSQSAFGFSKPRALTHEDSLALFPPPLPVKQDTIPEEKVLLRSLEMVRLDSVVALLTLADAHFSVHNYDKAGLFIRAAFAQYAKVNEARDDSLEDHADSVYAELVSKYKSYLAKQPILPPETPLAVLLEEDTEHIQVPEATRRRVDELLRVTPTEQLAFQKLLPPTKLQDLTTRPDKLPPIPIETNQRVENAMTFFMTRGKAVYERWLQRSERLLPVIVPILREEGIPEEIFCLAMIESGLNPQAYSKARAAGVYQFISTTGTRFGLQSGWWVDDRRNVEKSTRAACRYLRALYNQFGDWNLAIASYNCGEGRIARNIKREKTKDYWKMRRLPRETRNYIPTYLAALIIFQDPERWGFKKPNFTPPMESDTVMVDGVVDLSVAANSLGIPYDELKWRNLELMQFCTDPTVDRYPLRVPLGMGKLLLDTLRKLDHDKKIRWTDHVVRKGETLRSISRKYGLSEKAISALPWNYSSIRGKNSVIVGSTLKFPVPVGELAANGSPPGVTPQGTRNQTTRERNFVIVKRGNTLSKIAVEEE
ncbi:MAG: transglycosylase SLT domain-containing protein, partial [bacterium]|nr:transglycosylase SLT domain-containing protein [bacterium]